MPEVDENRSKLWQQYDKFIRLISRRREEQDRLESPGVVRAKLLVFGVFAVFTLGVFAVSFKGELKRWAAPSPDLIIPQEWWKVMYDVDPKLCADALSPPVGCPAHPQHQAFWDSPYSRADKEHFERVRAIPNQTYWIGLQLPPEYLKKAASQEANELILGWISSSYKIWLDGELVNMGNAESARLPLVVSLSHRRIAAAKEPVQLFIEIHYNLQTLFPDMLERKQERLASRPEAENYMRLKNHRHESQPWILMYSNLLVAALFFFFWFSARKKQEYWYLAMYSLVHGFLQLTLIDFVFRDYTMAIIRASDFVGRMYEGSFAMLLGLAYARVRIDIFHKLVPVLLVLPIIAIGLAAGNTDLLVSFNSMANNIFVPLCLITGIFACVSQWFYLKQHPKLRDLASTRVRRLGLFVLSYSLLILIYWFNAHLILTIEYVVIQRFAHFIAVGFISLVVLIEYRDQERLVQNTHLSKYHKMTPVPERVYGAMLKIDLKQSTKMAAHLGSDRYYLFVTDWYKLLVQVALRAGAEVLSEEGDSITFFFDEDGGSDGFANVLQTTREMHHQHRWIEEAYTLRSPLYFRASITYGELRPLWKETGSIRKPGYGGDILIDAARIMDLEYQIPEAKNDSTVIFLPGTKSQAFVRNEVALTDKDGKARTISYCKLSDLEVKLETAV
jgi:hypothetical protein